jgi:hypothetical protein
MAGGSISCGHRWRRSSWRCSRHRRRRGRKTPRARRCSSSNAAPATRPRRTAASARARTSSASSAGRPAGSLSGFAYSPAFAGGKDGLVWARATLDRWIENPQQTIPGAVMAYKQPDSALRARLIDYLETLK